MSLSLAAPSAGRAAVTRLRPVARGSVTSRRAIAGAIVLALVAAFLVAAPMATHPAAADTTRPAPNEALPPCVDDGAGGRKGACNAPGTAVGVSASGTFGSDGAVVDVNVTPGIAICDSWPGRSVWNPSPCWAGASISVGSPVHLDEDGDDLVSSGAIFTPDGGSASILERSLLASTWDASTTVASRCGATTSDFHTYIYGGHQQNAPWRSIGRHALECTLTWDGDRPDDLKGSTWIPVRASLSVRTNTSFDQPASATTWVRLNGDMQNPGPEAAFSHEAVTGGTRLVNESTHPWDLGMTYEWQLPDGTVVTDTSPVVSLSPGTHSVRLTATDVDGESDSVRRDVRVSPDALGVTITRDAEGPVEVGEAFDVVLTVAAPPDNTGVLTGVAPDGPALALPTFLEHVGGEMPSDFDLTPGSLRRATLTLRATAGGTGTVSSRWTGTDGSGETVAGEIDLPITARGTITGAWFRTDGLGGSVRERETVPVRLRVDNGTGAPLTDLQLTGRSVGGHGDTPGTAIVHDPSPGTEGRDEILTLPDGLDASGPGSVGFVDVDLEGVEEGDVRLAATVEGTDPQGDTISGTVTADWVVRATDLTIEITFDPPEHLQQESADPDTPPEPVEMTATVTMTNTSGGDLTDVTIEEFEVSRLFGEQQLWLEQVGGQRLTNWDAPGILLEEPTGTDDPLEPFDLDDGDVETFTADFIARDDGQLDFHVLALAADEDDATVRGYGEASWVVTPEKYLEVTTEVIIPQDGELLEAGEAVVIKGRVVNLSQTASLEVGPLIPIPSGNTGQLSLVYGGGAAPDPTQLPGIPGPLELGPGDSELFEVAIATGYSDPRTNLDTGEPEVAPTGGTRAYFEFDPWATATEADGTVRTVRTDPQTEEDRGVKIADEHRNLTVSIDDSIPIPELDYAMLAGGIGAGIVTGIVHAGVGLVVGVVETIKLPYTLTVGAMEYQSRVWNSFTEEEKALYTEELSTYVLAMAVGNVENGLKDAEQLKDDIDEMIYGEMTRLANEWETGDYVSTAEAYAAGGSEIAASLWLPAAMTKLAQTPRAAAALERAQLAVNARMGPIFAEARTIRYVEDALPLLRALENGAEISADAMRALYGVTPEEVAELQRLAQKYELLITFRSRHPSSVQWIERFGAMMKPEAIKIKTVSEMDLRLGYRAGDLGSVVFRKPDVLRTAPAPGETFLDHVRDYVTAQGFTPGTKDFDSAVDRVKLRVKEWYKHEQEYKTYDQRKWIPTEFNYEGNAIRNAVPDRNGRQTGFKLDEVGDEEYVVRLLDPRDGRFKRVTGDIDPIAFTNLDGSPLTQSQHRDLINDMRASAILRAQHPESATFTGYVGGQQVVNPGLDFIESQFKPLEAAAQIGPDGPVRAVRLHKGKSRWESVRDYHLHWEGGYKHVSGRDRIDQRTDFDPDFGRDADVDVPVDFDFKPVQLGEFGEGGIGRATVEAVKTGTGTAVFLGEGGQLIEVNPDGTTQPYEGSAALFEEGEPIDPADRTGRPGRIDGQRSAGSLAHRPGRSGRGHPRTGPGGSQRTSGRRCGPRRRRSTGAVRSRPGRRGRRAGRAGRVAHHRVGRRARPDVHRTRRSQPDDIVVMVQPAPVAPGDPVGPPDPDAPAEPDDPDGPREVGVPRDTDRACGAAETYDNPFSDLVASNTHYRTLLCMTDLGIARGFTDGTYRPATNLTRDQMATFIANMIELERELPAARRPFGDVDADNPHAESIHELAQAGAVQGRRRGHLRAAVAGHP